MTSTIKADVVTAQATNGNVTLQGNGTGTVAISDNTAITGTATVSSTLGVTGATTLSGQAMPTSGGLFSGRSVVVNGGCQVAQRGASFASVTASGTYPVDRFLFHVGSLGTWTLTRDTDVPTGEGFYNSIKCDVTTADASPSGLDYARIDYRLEGQDCGRFRKGTASAEKFALSFWVKSPKTGTHIVELQDGDNNRTISKAYTVSSANTWEQQKLIIDADTTGALDNDNAKSLTIAFWLAAGTDYTSGSLQTSWGTPTNANRVAGTVNCADNAANNFYLTGVQLECGDACTPFEFESYGETLQKCMRYYQLPHNWQAHSDSSTATAFKIMHSFPVPMRASPTIGTTGTPTCVKMNANAAGPTTISVVPTANANGFNGNSFTTMATGAGSAAATDTPYVGISGFTASAEL